MSRFRAEFGARGRQGFIAMVQAEALERLAQAKAAESEVDTPASE
jgi:hypothetical protein